MYERRCSRTRAHTHIHTHTRTHARTWPCGRNLLHNDSLKLGPVYVPFVAGSRDACKGATIDWYSFRGRLYPRTFSRSFVTGAGIEMCRLFGRRVMHSTHSPLPPLFLHSSRPRAPRKHFRRLFLSTRAMKERALSLFIFLSVPTEATGNRHVSFPMFQTWIPLLDRIWLLLLLLLLPDDAFFLLWEI